jgi:peptidoglycan/LPS O-acetylase OafA/YrhL
MVTLGRWSYGIFVWHLGALAMVFPVIGEFAFSGSMPVVLVLTLIFAIAIAAVSYALVESPCREGLRRLEHRNTLPGQDPRDVPGLEPVSSVAAPATA